MSRVETAEKASKEISSAPPALRVAVTGQGRRHCRALYTEM